MNVFRTGFMFLFLSLAVLSAQAATWTTIDVPGAKRTEAISINIAGDVAGRYQDNTGLFHGFVLSGGVFTSVDAPDSNYTALAGINDNGLVVGTYNQITDGKLHSFVFDGVDFTPVEFPAADTTDVSGINNEGDIVGSYTANNSYHGFKLSNGTYITVDRQGAFATFLIGISNKGFAVGFSLDSKGLETDFLLNPQGHIKKINITDLPFGVNSAKVIVGGRGQYGFKYVVNTQTFSVIRVPHGKRTECNGINDAGQMVGWYTDSHGLHGFLRTP